jgi:3-phenylpropionate/trans-cinnamate dioxygenase ferredoxin reductase subunit
MRDGVVIVGAGHGGVQAAASLREDGFDGPVILVGEEDELPYHKPPLSKTFLKEADARPQPLRGEAFYEAQRIDLRLGHRVERIDMAARAVELAGSPHRLRFDRLVLATGSRPRSLPVPGAGQPNVVSLRSLADARRIRDLAQDAGDVLVIGGGFIGLEMAATLAGKGHKVTVVEAQDRILGRAVSPFISRHVHARLEAAGIRILLNTTLARLEGDGSRATGALTSAGEIVAADLAIVGIGVVPDVALAEAAGLRIDNGITVDACMRSSAPQVLALGDNASYEHWMTGRRVRLESVQNATDQARLAAGTILGRDDPYAAVPWFWSDIGDMKLQMVGLPAASDSQILSGEPEANRFSVYHFAGDRLMSIDSVNRPADHMLGRRMLAAGYSPTRDQVEAGGDAVKAAFMLNEKR